MSGDKGARLCSANVGDIPEYRELPYDRKSLVPGIVHLGLGAFHRAHQAVFHHKALSRMSKDEASKWGIVGVSLRSAGVRDQLSPQDCLYTVHERSCQTTEMLVIGCLTQCVVAPEDPAAVLNLLALPSVRIVSLTVTEKGYCYDPATRKLDVKNADVAHDLLPENTTKPKSSIGFIVQALKMRRAASVEPFTVLTCDNLPHNGDTVRGICAAFAAELTDSGDLSPWIQSSVSFPCTMVDCIVPATKESDKTSATKKLGGLLDDAMVVCEPFRQWVIQDSFGPLGRPPWEDVGAQIVRDVAVFEDAKLSILNGCHSALAYSGFLCGIEFIWQTMSRESLRQMCKYLLQYDVLPILSPPEGVDLNKYADEVLGRFQNTALEHRTFQVAMDGSQKLPQRLLGSARKNLQKTPGAKLQVIPFAVAAWMHYVSRFDGAGCPIKVQDPLADKFAEIARETKGNARNLATALLAIESIFGKDELVDATDEFVEPVILHLERLMSAADEKAVYDYICEFVKSLAATEEQCAKKARTY